MGGSQNLTITPESSSKIAKMSFLCALFVVASHTSGGPKWLQIVLGIKPIAVPFFFLLSGYLFAGRFGEVGWYFRQLKKRFASLFIPYVIWNFVYWLFAMGLVYMQIRLGLQSRAGNLDGTLWQQWDVLGLHPLYCPALGALWFVRCLLVITLLSPLFCVFTHRWSFLLVFAGFVFALAVDWKFPNPETEWLNIWMLKGWCRAVVYFGAGVWIRFNCQNISRGGGVRFSLISLAVGWIMLRSGNHLLYLVGIPIAILGLWGVLSAREWPRWLTSCAFPIYVLHGFFSMCIIGVIACAGLQTWAESSALAFVLKWLTVTGGSVLVAVGIRKWSLKMSNVVFGGR